jgi:hypothetical protein
MKSHTRRAHTRRLTSGQRVHVSSSHVNGSASGLGAAVFLLVAAAALLLATSS